MSPRNGWMFQREGQFDTLIGTQPPPEGNYLFTIRYSDLPSGYWFAQEVQGPLKGKTT